MIRVVALREMRSLFTSPFAWSLLAVLELLLAWLFLTQLEQFVEIQPQLSTLETAAGVTELVVAPFLESTAVLLLLTTPLITMRMISEEFRNGTYALIYSSPIALSTLVLGKFLAVLSLLALALALISLMPLSLLLGTQLDLYRMAAGFVGLMLLSLCISAIGLFISSLTDQPAVAAMGTYGLLLLLWVINLSDQSASVVWIDWLSLASHFRRLLSGLVYASDLIYYLLLTVSFIGLTIYRLDCRRR